MSSNWLDRDSIAYHAGVRPNKLAVIDFASGRGLSYRELDERVARCAGMLRAQLGETRGERVAILARNGLDYLTLVFGALRAAAILQPLNWRLSGPELKALIDDAKPKMFIYEAEFEEAAKVGIEAAPGAKVLRIDHQKNEFAQAVEAAAPAEPVTADPQDVATLLYTSGTTGRSKGCIITREGGFFAGLNFSQVGAVTADSVVLCDAPMFHTVGLMAVSRTAMFVGATLAISDRFLPNVTLERLSDHDLGVTHYFVVPQMAMALRADPGYPEADLSGLKAMFTGGAPMPESTIEAFLDEGVTICNGFGMSEAGTVLGMPMDPEVIRKKPGSAGLPSPATEIRIVTHEGHDAGVDEAGEIWLRGPGITPGYWNQPEATANAFAEGGWMKTGDAALRDADGFYRLIDRWKDMYITGGENVYPAEVESALSAMPGVADVAVVGVADERWGESGVAFIALSPGANLTDAQVLAFCDQRLARYKRPAQVRFIDAIPRNASGKILKNVLREQTAKENAG